MATLTLEQAIETVMQRPREQQEMLLEIIYRRHVESRREETAAAARASVAAYRAVRIEPQSAQEVIAELLSYPFCA